MSSSCMSCHVQIHLKSLCTNYPSVLNSFMHSDIFSPFFASILGEGNASAIRLLHYPPLDKSSAELQNLEDDGKEPQQKITRCGKHTDYGGLTLLFQVRLSSCFTRALLLCLDAILLETRQHREEYFLASKQTTQKKSSKVGSEQELSHQCKNCSQHDSSTGIRIQAL